MSGSESSHDRAGQARKTRREIELERIKAQAASKAAHYHAMALQLEAELRQEETAPPRPRPASPKAIHTEDAEQLPGGPVAFWQSASSWLFSAVVHLVIILVLGALTLKLGEESAGTALTASIEGEEPAELEAIQLEDPADQLDLEQSQALPVRLEDPGMANLGEVAGTLTAADVSDLGTLDVSDTMGRIGTLFGRNGKGYASAGDGTGGASFFGVKAGGTKFAFVVDASMSMKRNGWEVCKLELIRAVERLKPHQSFYVILFNYRAHPMFSDQHPEPRPVRATPENIARLREWVYAFQLQTGTLPQGSMELALGMQPDAIYFLTDGRLHDNTEGYLRQKNKREDAYHGQVRASTVQTIGFYTQDGREVLQRIAEDNGGSFRYVAPPPGDVPRKPGNPLPGNRSKPLPRKGRPANR